MARRLHENGPGSVGQRAPVLALVVLAVLAGADRPPPPLVVPVPVDRAGQAVVPLHLWRPAQLALQLVRGQRIAAVVPGAIGDVLDQRLVLTGQLEDLPD